MPKLQHINFHNDQTHHVYTFLAKTDEVDVDEKLRQAEQLATAEIAAEEEAEGANAEAAIPEAEEWEVAETEVRFEGDPEADAEGQSTPKAVSDRANRHSRLTHDHFAQLLERWFEHECWPLIDEYWFLQNRVLGDVGAADIEDGLLLQLAASACHEIRWHAVAEALLSDAGKCSGA